MESTTKESPDTPDSPPRLLKIFPHSAQSMPELPDGSIHLVVTSPPYPMITMWDEQFALQDPAIGNALQEGKGNEAFERMHLLLDSVWKECYRVLCPGGFLCINIGDATRTIGGEFQLYSNHSRIMEACRSMGFTVLPLILWRKTTNAPNKFMGAGMFPAGAYVTLEHEYILIFRKGGKREFHTTAEKTRRRESAFFWEERNRWFVDLWDLSGVRQTLKMGEPLNNHEWTLRARSAAFPLELAYRLILMYSLREDWVLDPFLGTGTTLLAAAITGRNGVGYEVESGLIEEARNNILACQPLGVEMSKERLQAHKDFMLQRAEKQKAMRQQKRRNRTESSRNELNRNSAPYWNEALQVPVVTKQEVHLRWEMIKEIKPLEIKLLERVPLEGGKNSSGAYAFQVRMEPFVP